jgi:hypothetical protein
MSYHGAFIRKVIRIAVDAAIHARITTPATMIPMMTTLLGGVPDDLISLMLSLRNDHVFLFSLDGLTFILCCIVDESYEVDENILTSNFIHTG